MFRVKLINVSNQGVADKLTPTRFPDEELAEKAAKAFNTTGSANWVATVIKEKRHDRHS